MAEPYLIPAAQHRVEDVIERSRFITTVARAATADEARAFFETVRTEFPDANHNCWAFVAGPPGSSTSIGMSDAGEPHGTAGRPMLDVLMHSNIGEVAVVVTRYFGGTKLGKGGLVRAYGGCVQQVLASLPTELRVVRVDVRVVAAYSDIEMVRRSFAEHDVLIVSEIFGERVEYVLQVPEAAVPALQKELADLSAGRIQFHCAS